jgi:cyanophycinase
MAKKQPIRKRPARRSMANHPGTLFVIGGHEDRRGVHAILTEFGRYVGGGKLVVATVASSEPEGLFHQYAKTFKEAGVREISELIIRERSDALKASTLDVLKNARGVFFTGGDQLRVTSHIGGSPVYDRLHEIYREGGVIGGTSAGASLIADNMLVRDEDRTSSAIGEATLEIIPGLSFLRHVIIDQHFTQRGRLGRLIGAVCRNPTNLGLGLDENTGAIFSARERFHVVGQGAVYVVDARGLTYSNFADETTGQIMSVYDLKLHVLSQGDAFDLTTRTPHRLSKQHREALPKNHPKNEQNSEQDLEVS